MICKGTIINMIAIVIGGIIGLIGRSFIKERYQEALLKTTGLCVMFIGIAGAMEKMLYISDGKISSQGTMVLIGSFAIGTLIGEFLNIEMAMERFGLWQSLPFVTSL